MLDKKIVLVNNENSPLVVLKNALGKSGFHVASCSSGFDALDELRCEPGDLVVASVSLPDMSGFQLSSIIKTSDLTERIRVVVVGNRDELTDSFWKRASLSDLILERKDVEFDEEKAVEKIKSLLSGDGDNWKKETLVEHPLMPSDLTGRDLLKSFRELTSNLLMERSVGHFARSLVLAMNSRVEFMSRFFGYMKNVFGSEVTGLLVADPQSPWGIIEISGSVTKNAFEKLLSGADRALGLQSEPRLITHGEVAEKGGASIKATENIVVYGKDGQPLGAVVLGWTTKQSLDDQSRAIAELLKTHLIPVFHALFDMQQIQILKQAQSYSSSVDPVTGLYNVEFLIGFLQQQLLFSARQKLPVGLILLDVDRFLEINQEFGAEAGDRVLTAIAKRISSNIRSSDLLARYSGDQFAIVLPNTDITGSQTLAEKLRSDIENSQLDTVGGKPLHATISVGCAMFKQDDANPETILRDAKIALMQAKQAGRNRVSV